jgi:hypothetical protein
MSSIGLPSLVQVVSTPIHILSIDLFQHPHKAWRERIQHICVNYKSVLLGRILRAFPTFELGGIINDYLK